MKKFLILSLIGYLLYVVFHSDDKQVSDTAGNSGTSQSPPTKVSVIPKAKTGDANVSIKSDRQNVDNPGTNEPDNKLGTKLIETSEPTVKPDASLEDQYNQRLNRAERQFQWCESFNRTLEYYFCKHNKPTDYTHTTNYHLVIHKSDKFLFYRGNDFPYYVFIGGAEFQSFERNNGKYIRRSPYPEFKGARVFEFDPSTGKLFDGPSDLLICKRRQQMPKEVRVTNCKYAHTIENNGNPREVPKKEGTQKPLEFSPPLDGPSQEYKPSPLTQ